MAIYTILLSLSVFMIAVVLFIIQQTFFHWKREHKEETLIHATVHHPAVGIMMTLEHCILRRKQFPGDIVVYDQVTRSDISLQHSPSAHTIDNYAENTSIA